MKTVFQLRKTVTEIKIESFPWRKAIFIFLQDQKSGPENFSNPDEIIQSSILPKTCLG